MSLHAVGLAPVAYEARVTLEREQLRKISGSFDTAGPHARMLNRTVTFVGDGERPPRVRGPSCELVPIGVEREIPQLVRLVRASSHRFKDRAASVARREPTSFFAIYEAS